MKFQRDGFSVEAAEEKGRPLPDWYLEEPLITGTAGWFLDAFWDLNTCRSIGMGLGPIPWAHIVSYAAWSRLDHDLELIFVRVIRAMDVTYLGQVEKQQG